MTSELRQSLRFLIGEMHGNGEMISHLLDVTQSNLKKLDSPDFYEPPELVKFISCDTEDLKNLANDLLSLAVLANLVADQMKKEEEKAHGPENCDQR